MMFDPICSFVEGMAGWQLIEVGTSLSECTSLGRARTAEINKWNFVSGMTCGSCAAQCPGNMRARPSYVMSLAVCAMECWTSNQRCVNVVLSYWLVSVLGLVLAFGWLDRFDSEMMPERLNHIQWVFEPNSMKGKQSESRADLRFPHAEGHICKSLLWDFAQNRWPQIGGFHARRDQSDGLLGEPICLN